MKGNSETKLLMIIGLIVILGVGAMFGLDKLSGGNTPPVAPTPKPFSWNDETFNALIKDAKHVHEVPSPTVTIVEFADFQCPSCRRAYNTVLHKMKRDKPVRFIFRHLPLVEMHERAMPAAMAVEAADKQGKFWEMYDALFDGEKTELTDDFINKCAKNAGVELTKFQKDLENPESRQRIQQDMKMANEYHIGSTPTFVIKNTDGTYTQAIGGQELQKALLKAGIVM